MSLQKYFLSFILLIIIGCSSTKEEVVVEPEPPKPFLQIDISQKDRGEMLKIFGLVHILKKACENSHEDKRQEIRNSFHNWEEENKEYVMVLIESQTFMDSLFHNIDSIVGTLDSAKLKNGPQCPKLVERLDSGEMALLYFDSFAAKVIAKYLGGLKMKNECSKSEPETKDIISQHWVDWEARNQLFLDHVKSKRGFESVRGKVNLQEMTSNKKLPSCSSFIEELQDTQEDFQNVGLWKVR